MPTSFFFDGQEQEIPSWIVEQFGDDAQQLSKVWHDLIDLPTRILPPDLVTQTEQTETILLSPYAESSPTESSNDARQYAFPLDEYLNLEGLSDEEMEETTLGDPSTTTSTPSPVPQPAKVRQCLWEGCRTKFKVGTYYNVWKGHIRSAHVEQKDEGGSRLSKMAECQWDGCGRVFKQPHGIMKHMEKHMETHIPDIRSPCPLGCRKSLRAEGFAIAQHMRTCPLRETRSTRRYAFRR